MIASLALTPLRRAASLPVSPAAAWMAALGVAGFVWQPSLSDILDPPAGSELARRPAAVAAPSFEAFAARPLFDPSRKRTEEPQGREAPAKSQELPFEQAYLVRGMISGLGRQVVIVQNRSSGRFTRLEPGQVIDGHRFEALEPPNLVFSRAGEQVLVPAELAPAERRPVEQAAAEAGTAGTMVAGATVAGAPRTGMSAAGTKGTDDPGGPPMPFGSGLNGMGPDGMDPTGLMPGELRASQTRLPEP